MEKKSAPYSTQLATCRYVTPLFLYLCLLATTTCADKSISLQPSVVVAIFDPALGKLPTPNDLLYDLSETQVSIPLPPESPVAKSPLEIDIIKSLNRHRGWSSRTSAEIHFSAAIAPSSIHSTSLQVWNYGTDNQPPVQLDATSDYTVELLPGATEADITTLKITPFGTGWLPGHRYIILAAGGAHGLRGEGDREVVADAAFWFLRQKESLLLHPNALPGTTAEERLANAEKLEPHRQALAPLLAHVEERQISRRDVAHLWSFHITDAPEILMDKALGKMPVPSDFLRSPATGQIVLPIDEETPPFEAAAREVINTFDGFGLSSNLFFELSSPIAPSTLTEDAIRLFEIRDTELIEIPIELETRAGETFVLLKPVDTILEPNTHHLVVVTDALQNEQGLTVEPMMPGVLALARNPLIANGTSQLTSLELADAAKIEQVRAKTAKGLDLLVASGDLEREQVRAAWSFKTLSVVPKMLAARDAPYELDLSPDPTIDRVQNSLAAILEFPVGITSLVRVGSVYHGTLLTPDFLDPITHSPYENGHWNATAVPFTMTVPRSAPTDKPLPVVIFGHAVVTERRFTLGIADAFAAEGIATISIDLPYHGERTHCTYSGPMCFVNPLDTNGDLLCPNPCSSGTECAPDGRCVDNGGQGNERSRWPVIPMYQSSGSLFIEMENLGGTVAHFHQAVTDLSSLLRSLRLGDWESAIGYQIDPDISFVGQSLGAIVGALFTAAEPSIDQVVLNVPGADLVELMRASDWFGPQFDHFLGVHQIQPGSVDHELLLNMARWMMDLIDPQTFAPFLKSRSIETGAPLNDRAIMIQMATLDIIIKNPYTRLLAERSEVPRFDYFAEHAFAVIPIEPAYYPGNRDMARLVSRRTLP